MVVVTYLMTYECKVGSGSMPGKVGVEIMFNLGGEKGCQWCLCLILVPGGYVLRNGVMLGGLEGCETCTEIYCK